MYRDHYDNYGPILVINIHHKISNPAVYTPSFTQHSDHFKVTPWGRPVIPSLNLQLGTTSQSEGSHCYVGLLITPPSAACPHPSPPTHSVSFTGVEPCQPHLPGIAPSPGHRIVSQAER